jgi:hypothetical protein
MKVENFDKSQERKLLTAMIVDTTVLSRISSKWTKEGLFRNKWSNIIAGWCVHFYNRYNKAPKQSIEGLFQRWAEDQPDQTEVSLIEKFLTKLSGEYERLKKDSNSEYLIDLAVDYFNKVRLEKLVERVQGDLDTGKVDHAYQLASSFGKLEVGVQHDVDLFHKKDLVKKAFSEKTEPLIKYDGALGNFFGSAFERDAFVGLMGPEKRGKTWVLMDIAYTAMEQGNKVAFLEIGDLSQNQITRRFMTRAAKRPMKPKTLYIPTSLEHPEGERIQEGEITHEEKEFKYPLTYKKAWKACQRVVKLTGSDPLLKLWCFPNSTLSISGLQAELQLKERTGWVPDVIVIDYADLLAPMPGYAHDSQDQIDMAWKTMRSISQQLHCCVVTATQSSAASYYADTLDKTHFSRDKRKFAHVTAMFGLNQTKDEKRLGVMRFNWLQFREAEFDEDKCVHVAGCLGLANPCMFSTF